MISVELATVEDGIKLVEGSDDTDVLTEVSVDESVE
jgi:hypothetical protein